MHRQKIAVMIQAGCGILMTVSKYFGIYEEGLIIFVLFLIPFIVCFIDDKSKTLCGEFLYATLTSCIMTTLISVQKIITINSENEILNRLYDKTWDYPATYELYMIASLGISIPIFIYLQRGVGMSKAQNNFEE